MMVMTFPFRVDTHAINLIIFAMSQPFANSHHRRYHEGQEFEPSEESEIEQLIAAEVDPDEGEKKMDSFREAGEAMAKLWRFIFSDTAGNPVEFGKESLVNVGVEESIKTNRDRQTVNIITRNLFVITLMTRPELLPGADTLRSLEKVLEVSRETLSRTQLRASDTLRFHARSQKEKPRAGTLAERLKRNKGVKPSTKRAGAGANPIYIIKPQ